MLFIFETWSWSEIAPALRLGEDGTYEYLEKITSRLIDGKGGAMADFIDPSVP